MSYDCNRQSQEAINYLVRWQMQRKMMKLTDLTNFGDHLSKTGGGRISEVAATTEEFLGLVKFLLL